MGTRADFLFGMYQLETRFARINSYKKCHDSVGREFLWVVLACFGVPEKMLTVIRQFNDGKHVCSHRFYSISLLL